MKRYGTHKENDNKNEQLSFCRRCCGKIGKQKIDKKVVAKPFCMAHFLANGTDLKLRLQKL